MAIRVPGIVGPGLIRLMEEVRASKTRPVEPSFASSGVIRACYISSLLWLFKEATQSSYNVRDSRTRADQADGRSQTK